MTRRSFFKSPVNVIVIAAFVLLLVVGLFTYDDYGIVWDDLPERDTSIINYQYVYKLLRNRDLNINSIQLHDHVDKYYGVFLQFPMVFVENLTHFTMPKNEVFLMRHLGTFLLCYAGYICFFFFLKNVFENKWLALLGTGMLVLFPRFWGEQFTNIKDMVFMGLMCACLLVISLCLRHEGKWRYDVLAAFVFAVSANTRIIGFMMPCLLFGYRILRDCLLQPVDAQTGEKRKLTLKNLGRYLLQLVIILLFYIAITPPAWENPIAFLQGAWKTFSSYDRWVTFGFHVSYLGTMYEGNQLPWHYHLVWMGVTLPIWYLLTVLPAIPILVTRSLKSAKGFWVALLDDSKYLLLCFAVPAAIIVAPWVKKAVFYNGWRHIYFVVPFLITLMVFTMAAIWNCLREQKVIRSAAAALVILLLVGQGVWCVQNHPFEKVYFNPVGRTIAEGMDGDYWRESTYAQLNYILENDPSEYPSVNEHWVVECTLLNRFPRAQARRFDLMEGGDYAITFPDTAGDAPSTPPDGFTLVHEIKVDGTTISSLWLKTDVLNERFGGKYPE